MPQRCLSNFRLASNVLPTFQRPRSRLAALEYCDVVANFYEKLFRLCSSDETKLMVLRRLPVLGCSLSAPSILTLFLGPSLYLSLEIASESMSARLLSPKPKVAVSD